MALWALSAYSRCHECSVIAAAMELLKVLIVSLRMSFMMVYTVSLYLSIFFGDSRRIKVYLLFRFIHFCIIDVIKFRGLHLSYMT
jgi:hypothetical protein